jgi:hypothetical protein
MEVKATWNYLGFKALDHSQTAGFLTRIEYLKWYSEGRARRHGLQSKFSMRE